MLAAKVEETFDRKNPVRTIKVSKIMRRDYGTITDQLDIARNGRLLKRVPRVGRLPAGRK